MINGNNLSKLFYALFISLLFLKSYSQEKLNATEIETKTIELYNNKNWNSLIIIGNEAVKNGNDYFYLRMRLGIAYYEQKNYSLAVEHLNKAIGFNASDDLTNEYLYYSYIFLGKDEEARKLSRIFSFELTQKLNLNNRSKVDFIALSGGSKTANSEYSNSNNLIYYKPANFFELGLKHYIKNKFSLFHDLNTFNQESYLGKITQNQYYALATIPLKNNWSIASALDIIQVDFTSKTRQTNFLINNNNFGGPPGGIPPGGPAPIKSISTNNIYFVGSIALNKSIKKFDFSVGSTFSNISNINQYNHFCSLTYSVFGNSKLVLGLTDYLHTSNNYAKLNNSFSTFVYLQPLKFASLKLSFFKNQNDNIIESNGYLVNNTTDLTTSRFSALVNFSINKTFSVFTLYQLEKKQVYLQNYDYQYNVFLAGIKINSPF